MDLENLGGESAEPIGGFVTEAWYAKKSDFGTIVDPKKLEDEDPAKVADTYSELVEITDNHVFKTTKCFKTIKFIQETGELNTKPIGGKGGKLFENEIVVEIGGSKPELLGFMRAIKNEEIIFLIKEIGTENVRQLGFSKYGASADCEHAIAGVLEGKNSAKITFKDKNVGPASIYKGEISVVPAP